MLDSSQLSHFRERQLASMMDLCRILSYSGSQDEYNEKRPTYTEIEVDIPCGLDMRPGSERERDKDIIVSYDATIRLPLTVSITEKDQIKIVERFGEAITPIVFDVAAPIQRGPSAIRLLLSKATL